MIQPPPGDLIYGQPALAERGADGLPPSGPSDSHGRLRADDLLNRSGSIITTCNGPRWCHAPNAYGPPKTLYKRWSDQGIFARTMTGLAADAAVPKMVVIDASFLRAHPTATSLRWKKGCQATGGPA